MTETEKSRKIEELLTRGVNEVIDKESLRKKLLSGKTLRVKLGIDPTSPNLHLGRSIPILKLKDFQDLGHQIVLIMGDFTGIIGDTSDKESERPMLEQETVDRNFATYAEQAGKILDISNVEVRRNSEWLGKLTYKEIATQANIFSLAEFIARENIAKRLEKGSRISLRELLYPLMQGYDSVAIEADVELGGTDQRFNLLAGRELQRQYGQEAQDIVMNDLIAGIDGRKMSSSWGNTVNLLDAPNDMFGKVMSMGDGMIITYFTHATRVPLEQVAEYEKALTEGANPRDVKLRLAHEIVRMYHDETAAQAAEDYFVKVISNKEIPDDVREVAASDGMSGVDYLVVCALAESKSDARRKIEQGGVSIDGRKVAVDITLTENMHDGQVMKVGKKDFVRIVFEK